MSSAMLITIVAARLLSKDELGSYFLIMLVVAFANVFCDIGLGTSAIKFLSADDSRENHKLTQYLWTNNLIVALCTSCLLYAVMPLLCQLSPSPYFQEKLWYAIPIVLLNNNFEMGMALMAGYRLYKRMSLTIQLVEITRMTVSLLGLYWGYGIEAMFAAMLLTRSFGIMAIARSIPAPIRLLYRYERAREILSYSGWIYGSSIMSMINVKLVDFILTTNLGTAGLATYSTAMQIPSIIQKVFESVKSVILGYLSTLGLKALETSIVAVRLLSAFLVISTSFLIAISHELVLNIFTAHYVESIPIMQILSAWMAFGLINYYLLLTLLGMGFSKSGFLLSVPQLIVTLLCGWLLVPIYQGMGAAASLILTSVVGNLFAIGMITRGSWRHFIKLNGVYFRAILLLSGFLLLQLWYQPSVWPSLALWVALVLMLFITRAITLNDVRAFTKLKG